MSQWKSTIGSLGGEDEEEEEEEVEEEHETGGGGGFGVELQRRDVDAMELTSGGGFEGEAENVERAKKEEGGGGRVKEREGKGSKNSLRADRRLQDLYHFTIGGARQDKRIQSANPYPQ